MMAVNPHYVIFTIAVILLGFLPDILRCLAFSNTDWRAPRNLSINGSNNRYSGWTQQGHGRWIKNENQPVQENVYGPSKNSGEVTDDELRSFSEQLLNIENNGIANLVTINYQQVTTSRSQNDEAPLPLMKVNDQVYKIPTVKALVALYDNYVRETNVAETVTNQEQSEENTLLNAVLATPVMEHARNFLIQKGKLSNNKDELKNLLLVIWFNLYPRGSKKISSCGFEHVFMAEIKKGTVSGQHNWLYFYQEEAKRQANYLGYMRKIQLSNKGAILKHHSTYYGLDKPVGSMFLGTSPELEIALYSVCFILRADKICPLKMDGKRFIIRTYSYKYKGKNMIGSAFPEI